MFFVFFFLLAGVCVETESHCVFLAVLVHSYVDQAGLKFAEIHL